MKTAKLKLTLSRIFRCFLDVVLCDNFSMFILFNISSGKLLKDTQCEAVDFKLRDGILTINLL